METIPYLDLRAQYRTLRSEVLSALEEICESTSFAQGQATADFEAKFAAYCGVDHCVSLNSGTSALHLALRCLDVGPGDEVVTVSMTFIATAWAISYVGATPVYVDIDPARRTNLGSARIGTSASPARRSLYRRRARSQCRYRQCLGRGLSPPIVRSQATVSSSNDIGGHDGPQTQYTGARGDQLDELSRLK